jgi:hypothetical protein
MPVATSHSRTLVDQPPMARVLPSGLNAITSAWPAPEFVKVDETSGC